LTSFVPLLSGMGKSKKGKRTRDPTEAQPTKADVAGTPALVRLLISM
jgi:hypothetical protein